MLRKNLDLEAALLLFEDFEFGSKVYDVEDTDANNREAENLNREDDRDHMKHSISFHKDQKRLKKERTTRSLKKILKTEGDELRKQLMEKIGGGVGGAGDGKK
jgi:hypothetical protein